MSLLPWPDLLRAALVLGVKPDEFWALSIAEWRALAATQAGPDAGLSKDRFNALCAAFPDKEDKTYVKE
jgi:uncharacterized phage protein (TIGR02216 family)